MGDDMISNALIWLTMKLVNFIAAGDEFPHELGLGIRQKQLLEYWESLERQLNAWYEGLPESFRPTSTVWPDRAEVCICENTTVPGAKILTMATGRQRRYCQHPQEVVRTRNVRVDNAVLPFR